MSLFGEKCPSCNRHSSNNTPLVLHNHLPKVTSFAHSFGLHVLVVPSPRNP